MRYAKNREAGEAKASNDAQGNDKTGGEGAGGSNDAGPSESDSASRREKAMGKKRFVYFIKASRFVKVGSARDVGARLSQLRIHVPDAVLLGYIPGSYDREHEIHGLLAEQKSHGEWFKDSRRLREVLESLPLIKIAPKCTDLVGLHIHLPYSVWLSTKTKAAKAGISLRDLVIATLEVGAAAK